MLKVGGENVAAGEIERVILTVPGVREAAVVGKPHDFLAEVPVAFVLVEEHVSDKAALVVAVESVCAANLADFKRPREVRLVAALPRSVNEKVAKGMLRKMAEEGGR
jgi:crotonobetaine/carnitine-CoA ligase